MSTQSSDGMDSGGRCIGYLEVLEGKVTLKLWILHHGASDVTGKGCRKW